MNGKPRRSWLAALLTVVFSTMNLIPSLKTNILLWETTVTTAWTADSGALFHKTTCWVKPLSFTGRSKHQEMNISGPVLLIA